MQTHEVIAGIGSLPTVGHKKMFQTRKCSQFRGKAAVTLTTESTR